MIERRLPYVVDEIVDSAVSDGRDQISDECKLNEAEFREQVDDGNAEVRMTANDCMKEIEEQMQKSMDDVEHQRIEVELFMEKKVAEFKRWSNDSASSLLDGKTHP